MATKRRDLTLEEQEDVRRLQSLWDAYRRQHHVYQRDASKALGITQAAFSQYLNGVIPLNTDIILAFSQYLGVSPPDIRPSLENATDVLKNALMSMPDDERAALLAEVGFVPKE